MDTGHTLIINNFFNNNYYMLIQKCKDYSRVYNYKELEPEELVSELLIYTLNNTNRTNKLQQLIQLSAATLSKAYNYSSQAFYYIARILYNITHGHRSFDNNLNKPYISKIKLIFEDNIERREIEDFHDINNYYDIDITVIYKKALELSVINNNWWKYKVWYDYYNNKLTYKKLSQKYKLSITPLFSIVHSYNDLLKESLKNIKIPDDI